MRDFVEIILMSCVAIIAINMAIGASVFAFFLIRDMIKENL